MMAASIIKTFSAELNEKLKRLSAAIHLAHANNDHAKAKRLQTEYDALMAAALKRGSSARGEGERK